MASDVLVAAKSGTRTRGEPAEPRGRGWQAQATARSNPAAGAGEASLAGQLDGGTSHGALGRDRATLGTFQGQENELVCPSVHSVRGPAR